MSATQLKCGCVFDGKSFEKYCREHGLKLLRNRFEKQLPAKENATPAERPKP
jgi:hypothetical protein